MRADRIGFIDPAIRLMAAGVLMNTGRPDEAVSRLEQVLNLQYMTSRAWLAVDPTWAPAEGESALDRLVAERRTMCRFEDPLA